MPLVLDVKTGSGAFLRKREDAEYLAALMVATAEAAGTRTVALLTDMDQPLGRAAGNWIEIAESIELLRGARPTESEDLRELSLILAGWMIHLGGQAATPEAGYTRAEAVINDGSALRAFFPWSRPRAAILQPLRRSRLPQARRDPGARSLGDRLHLRNGYHRNRLGRAAHGRRPRKAGEPVDPHAGILFHARRGARVEKGQPIATLYATTPALLPEPIALLKNAITFPKLRRKRFL
jgi:thymidine phosphorylase